MRRKRRGWLIALGLVLLLLPAALVYVHVTRVRGPTGIALDPSNLQPMALPISPDDAWPIFTDDADAADAYRKTIAAWDDSARSIRSKPNSSMITKSNFA